MKCREFGASGIKASVVGLGAWVIGGGVGWGEEPDDNESIRAIHAALDAGVDLIDTAPVYGYGRSERVVGIAIKGRREKVVVATKCGLWWDDCRGSFFLEYDGKRVYRSLRPDTIRIEIESSLKRLSTDYIDLYQTHWPAVDPEKTPIAETIDCLLELKKEGKIRAIGVSNTSFEELKENIACGEVVTLQPRYSMLCREIEKEILPYCMSNNIATLAYSPLEQGLLTGKVGMDRVFGPDEWRSNTDWNPWFKPENRVRVLAMLETWKDLTAAYGCTLAQLVIAWTVAQPGLTHALCGTRGVSQAVENADGGRIDITAEDLTRITRDVDALGSPW
ncbi:MAG: aldo/keto reductase [Deltaproteobacteria bacterium]|nr:aldo/keto reductase [Deltaproteobacteria bacterium]